eukprot:330382-Pyramimonas_sp.AAC.2
MACGSFRSSSCRKWSCSSADRFTTCSGHTVCSTCSYSVSAMSAVRCVRGGRYTRLSLRAP